MAIVQPANLNFDDIRQNANFAGITVNLSVNGKPFNLNNYTISAIFKSSSGTYNLNTGSGITILNAAMGIFQFDPASKLTWNIGTYNFSVIFTDVNNKSKIYIIGTRTITA